MCFAFEQLGVFSSQVFQESPRDKIWKRKHCNAIYLTICNLIIFPPSYPLLTNTLLIVAPIYGMEKHCNIEIAAQISRVSTTQNSTWVL